ncbi:DUF1127 domain-containing protein [Pelagibacterium xiamenense]|uniref:DUF1127 domain-containing protein n=1 Tax=Pelagibacterium xiamenense TaxID=2901140 RepID=UPI001E42D7C0|nr:DUF1127 domain-containing protein [Pelagibacterium xiamenense]MCD7060883.1 DUF1127 domain-containing protein [Pelagibacterium xiamenense]
MAKIIKTTLVFPLPARTARWRSVRATLSGIAWACARRRQRRRLSELSDQLLADIGLSRDIVCERARPYWRS